MLTGYFIKILDLLNERNINIDEICLIINKMINMNETLNRNDYDYIEKIYEILNNKDILISNIKSNEDIIILRNTFNKLINKKTKNINEKIRLEFLSGKLELTNILDERLFNNMNMSFEILDRDTNENVTGILLKYNNSIDSAFSIKKIADMYLLDIYISDVPTYLNNNKKIAQYAYERANTINVRIDNYSSHKIEMLPPFLAIKYLSLNKGYRKNTIVFSFVYGSKGELYSVDVNRKNAYINDTITPEMARRIMMGEENGKLVKDLKIYRELYNILEKKDIGDSLKELQKMLLLGSRLVEKYVAKNSTFYIGKRSNEYVLPDKSKIAAANFPLKNIASNISLAFYLNEHNIKRFNKEDLDYIKDNKEQILEHLNYKKKILKFVYGNPDFAKKYVKKIDYNKNGDKL